MEFNQFIAVLDTNVLVSMPVADTLLRLAEEPAFYLPRWSEEILQELDRTFQKLGRTPAQIDRRIGVMRQHFPEAIVVGYEGLADSLDVDPKDRHVLACAIRAGAHAIVSNNRRDFPPATMRRIGIECLTAGQFLSQQYHLSPDRFLQILVDQHEFVGMSMAQLLDKLPEELTELIHF
jgi:predicted nucleic acid-binding protein